jgi:hypothetical protein
MTNKCFDDGIIAGISFGVFFGSLFFLYFFEKLMCSGGGADAGSGIIYMFFGIFSLIFSIIGAIVVGVTLATAC